MRSKTFFTLHTIIYASFALALFCIPQQLWPLYGVQIHDGYAQFLSQHTSIFLGGIAIITGLFRSVSDPYSILQLTKALFLTNLLGCTITSYALINGIFQGMGISDPIFFALLSAISLYQWKQALSLTHQ